MGKPQQPGAYFGPIIGDSAKMQGLLSQLRRVATTYVPVLLVGENNTGKSLAAHVIHELSSQHKDPFTKINCGFTSNDGVIGKLFGKGHI